MEKDKKTMFREINKPIKDIKCITKRMLKSNRKINENDKIFDRKMRKSELRVKILGIVLNAIIAFVAGGVITHYYSLAINNENNIYNYGKERTQEQKLYDAQNYCSNGQYEKAIDLYLECLAADKGIASLNLGYLFSKGLGCEANFNVACSYYEKAIELNLEDGLTNYLAINLITPNDYESTMKALKCGFEKDNKIAIRYLSYLQTGIMYDRFYEDNRENARLFLQKSDDEKRLALKEKLVISNVEIKEIREENLPRDTEFRTYSKYLNDTIISNTKSIKFGTEVNEGEERILLRTVREYKNMNYYIITNYKFALSDALLQEKFCKKITIQDEK